MARAFVFPGQGSQAVGMGRELADAFAPARYVFEEVDEALPRIVKRWARTHGPFLVGQLAERFGLRGAQVEPMLRALETEGVLVHGEIRPGGSELWHLTPQ